VIDELGRRLVHASGAGFPLLYVLGAPWWVVQTALVAFVFVAGLLEVLRLRVGLTWWVYDRLTRPYEQDNVAGYALYALGMAVVGVSFPPPIAVPALLMLAVADPVGGFLAGDDPTPIKRPVALVGTFLVAVGVAVPFLPAVPALAAAAVATAADGVFLRVRGYILDDNLTIPIGAATAAWVVTTVTG